MKFDTKNQRLTNFNDIRDFVVANTVKVELPRKEQKKEQDASLFTFG